MEAGREQVWAALVAHRDRAVRVALSRCESSEEAEDVVQEAFSRIAAMPVVDVDRIGSLLSAVIGNLAVDARRGRGRASRNVHRLLSPALPPPDEAVCDKAEARWLWMQRAALSAQDRRVLELRADGLSLSESAAQLGITYRAAENALGRARRQLRAVWRATAALVAGVLGRRGGRLAGLSAGPVALAAALALSVVPRSGCSCGPDGSGNDAVAAVTTQATLTHAAAPSSRPRLAKQARGLVAPRNASAPVRPPGGQARLLATTPVVGAGGAEIGPVPVTRQRGGESLAETLTGCLESGPVVSLTQLGCPP